MDLKELVCVKENFFDTASLNKFLKFVKKTNTQNKMSIQNRICK